MKANINGYKLTKNGKPITTGIGEVKQREYEGLSYKENGEYFYYLRKQEGFYIYSS